MKIGIIGFGFVGQAILNAYQNHDVVIRDPKLEHSASLDKFVDCDAIFICVPSPADKIGRCDVSILENVLKELFFVNISKDIPLISKVTAPPTSYANLSKQYPNLVYSPEFLTSANNLNDYKFADYFIVGGHREYAYKAVEILKAGDITTERFTVTDIKTASLYKYMMNSYLATKVTFMNEFYNLAQKEGVDWDQIIDFTAHDTRIGPTHMEVPGPDGKFGWGGHCFPKDISAIIEEAISLGINFELLDRVESINKRHRRKGQENG